MDGRIVEQQGASSMEERLEKALVALSSVVSEHGDRHLPLLRLLETQLNDIRTRKRALERRRTLARAIGQLADA
jgi:hypothetical protein